MTLILIKILGGGTKISLSLELQLLNGSVGNNAYSPNMQVFIIHYEASL